MAEEPETTDRPTPTNDAVTVDSFTPAPATPAQASEFFLDNYRLVRKVAEGGMGEVYEAEQLRPVRRTVAIKLIKAGYLGSEFGTRFESERQALAVMDHSAIAKIFDAGTTRQGQPYFSMEFVSGSNITDHCDRERLGLIARLQLYLDVCDGVNHAHQKGVIHRDIKPSNVLVTLEGDKARPKIIDFGVAKATGSTEVQLGGTTYFGQLIGTPEYMSPEQIAMDASGIDTRTDVYALGLLLYKLLTGRLPFDVKDFQNYEALKRQICEGPSPHPSVRLKSLGAEDAAEIAARRGTTPAALVRQLSGDLDWIVGKALEKERDRRYGSAAEFAADIRRHLANQPVLASPPTRRYRLGKFVRRHQVGVSAVAVASAALMVGTTLATVGLVRSRRAEAEARREAETANQVTEFLIDLYRVSDPSESRGNSVTARELLDKGAERIRTKLDTEPFVRTRLLFQMGRVYQALGLYPNAQQLLDLSLDAVEQAHDARLSTSALLTQLAELSWLQGKTDKALDYARQAVSRGEATLGPNDVSVALAIQLSGRIHRDRGEFDEAGRNFERALRIFEALDPKGINVAWTLLHVGWLHQLKAEYSLALPVYERALPIAERELADNDPNLGYFFNDIGVLQLRLGNSAKAEAYQRRALAVREKALGPDHPAVADTVDNIGNALWAQSRTGETRPYYERALAIRRKALGEEHPLVAASLNNVALAWRAEGRFDRALPLYEEALRIRERTSGPNHPETANVLSNMGNLLARLGNYPQAQQALERAVRISEQALGANHPQVASGLEQLAFMHLRKGDRSAAQPLFERAVQITESALGPDHVELGVILRQLGKLRGSTADLERAGRIFDKAKSTSAADVFWDLASLEQRRGRLQAAEELARQGRGLVSDREGARAAQWAVSSAGADAVMGFHDDAIFKLKQAVELGFADPAVGTDEVFGSLRRNAEFRALVATLEKGAR